MTRDYRTLLHDDDVCATRRHVLTVFDVAVGRPPFAATGTGHPRWFNRIPRKKLRVAIVRRIAVAWWMIHDCENADERMDAFLKEERQRNRTA